MVISSHTTFEKVLDLAVLTKASFYGDHSQLPPQQLKESSRESRKSFSRVIQDETERIENLVQKENQRIMKNIAESDVECPICLEALPPILDFEMRHKKPSLMLCCGKYCCKECIVQLVKCQSRRHKKPHDFICPYCRAPQKTNHIRIDLKEADSKKKWLLRLAAAGFQTGTMGMPKNKKKASEYMKKSADWGDASAQRELAIEYLTMVADEGTSQSILQARRWAERAAEQGDAIAQGILGEILINHNEDVNRAHDLISLAAFQGDPVSRALLAKYYIEKLPFNTESVDLRKNHNWVLSGYWCGKAAEIKSDDPLPRIFGLQVLVDCLLRNVRDTAWYEDQPSIGIDPLTGYSHIPFCFWAISQMKELRGTYSHYTERTRKSFQILKVWNCVCANCGSRDKAKLMKCPHCKAFSYCSKGCQKTHWEDGHCADCSRHWVEDFFPNLRNPIATDWEVW